jgi:translation initiation factor 3 subunit L
VAAAEYYNSIASASVGRTVAAAVSVPEPVKNFVVALHDCIVKQEVHVVRNLYEHVFNALTERFFEKQPWPSADTIAPLVRGGARASLLVLRGKVLTRSRADKLFMILYRELYFRHIYARLTPTMEQRFQSFENYCDLFDVLLSA